MSDPTKQIKYTKKCFLKVTSADNSLAVLINPDKEGVGGLSGRVFEYQSIGFASNPGAKIDLTDTLERLGGSANLAFVGANFQGPGAFKFRVSTDAEPKDWEVAEKLPQWTGKQWAVHLTKV